MQASSSLIATALLLGLGSCRAEPSSANAAQGAPRIIVSESDLPTLARDASGEPTLAIINEDDAQNQDAPVARETLARRLQVAGLEIKETKEFLDALQAFAAKNDRAGVCTLADYPLASNAPGANEKIANRASCVRNFELIFTTPVIAAITNQRLDALFARSEGVMIGDGAIWFSGICTDERCQQKAIKIISVNH